jgi:hypothetical protein
MSDKINYSKDGFCTTDIFQEKYCSGFQSLAGSGMCCHQGLGLTCEKPYPVDLAVELCEGTREL